MSKRGHGETWVAEVQRKKRAKKHGEGVMREREIYDSLGKEYK